MPKSIDIFSRPHRVLVGVWFLVCLVFGWGLIGAFLEFGFDFDLFYNTGLAISQSNTNDIYIQPFRLPRFVYSPPTALFFTPLSIFPLEYAKLLFGLLKVLLLFFLPFQLLIIASYCNKSISNQDNRALSALACFCVAIFYPSLREDFVAGNINILLTSVLAFVVQLWLSRRFLAASLLLSIACAFKPQFALIFLPMLCRHKKQVALGWLTAGLFLLIISVFTFGISGLSQHLISWNEIVSKPLASWRDVNNLSLGPMIRRHFEAADLLHVETFKSISIYPLEGYYARRIARFSLTIIVVLLFYTVFSWDRSATIKDTENQNNSFCSEFGLSLAFVNLLSPTVWLTHFSTGALVLFVTAMNFFWLPNRRGRKIVYASFGLIGFIMLSLNKGISTAFYDYARAYTVPNLIYLGCGLICCFEVLKRKRRLPLVFGNFLR